MITILFNQPAIWGFIAGLALVSMAALVLRMGRAGEITGWTLLGMFALVQALAQWASLAPLGGSHVTYFGLLRSVLGAVSFIALIEFGRREIKRDAKRLPKFSVYWIHAPILIVAALTVTLGGSAGIDTACRYALALPGGLLAALAIAQVTNKHQNAGWARMLLAAAIAFFALGYAKAIVPLQAFAALGLLTAVWLEHRKQRSLPAGASAMTRWRFPVAFVALAVLGAAALAVREQQHEQPAQVRQVYVLNDGSEPATAENLADAVPIDTRQLARDRAAAERYKQGAAILVVVVVIAAVWIGVSYLPSLK